MLAVETFVMHASFSNGESGEETLHSPHPRLETLKARVPEVRTRMGEHRWNAMVNRPPIATNAFTHGIRPVNRAFHKLYEILLSCAIPPPKRSVHLCEAPGGFVQATAHYVGPDEWSWAALTLEKGLEVHADLPTDRGRFVYGDVFQEDAAVAELGETADLVTGDGAVESEHARLEEDHAPLLYAQTRVALRLLRPGGTLVLKFFEGMRRETWVWIANLTHSFERVSVIKPTSSRPTNSERYLVGRGFLIGATSLFTEVRLSEAWTEHVRSLLMAYAERQATALACALNA